MPLSIKVLKHTHVLHVTGTFVAHTIMRTCNSSLPRPAACLVAALQAMTSHQHRVLVVPTTAMAAVTTRLGLQALQAHVESR